MAKVPTSKDPSTGQFPLPFPFPFPLPGSPGTVDVVVVEVDGVAAAPSPNAVAKVVRSFCNRVASVGVRYLFVAALAIVVATCWRSLAAWLALPVPKSVTAC